MSDDRVVRSRQRFERSLEDLRAAVDRELGWAPNISRWALPLVAAAVGVALGMTVRRNLPRLRERRRLGR